MGCTFFRSNTTDEELGELTKTTNPDEINIDEDYSSDEDEQVEGNVLHAQLLQPSMNFIMLINDKISTNLMAF